MYISKIPNDADAPGPEITLLSTVPLKSVTVDILDDMLDAH